MNVYKSLKMNKENANGKGDGEEEIVFGPVIVTQFEYFDKNGVRYNLGDFVMLEPPEGFDKEIKWLAQLSSIYTSREGAPFGVMKWLWRPSDIPSSKKTKNNPREVLITNQRDINSLYAVCNKCTVKYKSEFSKEEDSTDSFFCYRYYDTTDQILSQVTKRAFTNWVSDIQQSEGFLDVPGDPYKLLSDDDQPNQKRKRTPDELDSELIIPRSTLAQIKSDEEDEDFENTPSKKRKEKSAPQDETEQTEFGQQEEYQEKIETQTKKGGSAASVDVKKRRRPTKEEPVPFVNRRRKPRETTSEETGSTSQAKESKQDTSTKVQS